MFPKLAAYADVYNYIHKCCKVEQGHGAGYNCRPHYRYILQSLLVANLQHIV